MCAEGTMAQAPAKGAPAKGAAAPAARGARAPAGANLAQIMRAIPFPNSNIIFDVQEITDYARDLADDRSRVNDRRRMDRHQYSSGRLTRRPSRAER